jgi:hypothetical protein
MTPRGEKDSHESSREVELVHSKAAARPSALETRSRCYRTDIQSMTPFSSSSVIVDRIASPRASLFVVYQIDDEIDDAFPVVGANSSEKIADEGRRRSLAHLPARPQPPTARETHARVLSANSHEYGRDGGECRGRPRG